MSLNTKWINDCTELLMNMYWHLDAWWKDVQQRLKMKNKKMSDELIHRIIHNEWTKKNIIKYKMNFKVQPCCKSQICVSLSHLSYRAQSIKDTHRTILSWYIEVAADHETLNISKSDTWSELSAAHWDLVFDLLSLSSLHNLFKTLLYLFLITV